MGTWKNFVGLSFLVVGIVVVFGLSSAGCGKKSSQTGKTEEKCPVWFKDSDKDGYTDGTTKVSCEKPSDEYVSSATAGDCNDSDPNINPGKTEICDWKDNNCNGQTDEGNVCGIAGGPRAKVSAGEYHTCAIKQDGSLWCWGWNFSGQLGDGTNTSRTTPVQIMSSGVSSVSLGGLHTCAVKTDGSLWCWGYNNSGQLGDGTNADKNTPVQVMSSGVSSVAAGRHHTCAVKTDGSLWCWGNNDYGQLGDGTNTSRNTPVQIMSSGVSSVALGGGHTCAVKTDGSLWCWGSNFYGQLGDGTNADKTTPVQIMSSGVSSVALGYSHTCAVKTDGSLWCWGNNDSGQLGDGTNTSRNTPVQIMSGVSSVALGGAHTCAVKTDGSLWCWGYNADGQLGDGSAWRNTPVYIMNLGSGGGGAPSIRDESSFDNREQKHSNIEQEQTRYGCSSANIVFYVLHLFVPAFILFALRKRKTC
jgi:alpha-tubulin suppressor-like RCC1 family protein